MRNSIARAALIFLSFLAIAWPLIAAAQKSEDELNREATALFQQVMSPFCEGRSLNDCPSSKAHELKEQMKDKLAKGVPPDDILKDVFATYGEQYRAVPKNQGFGRLAWIAPGLFLLVGIGLWLLISMSRKQSVMDASSSSARPVSAGVQRQIDEELARLD
jgi:cytochrome c-type biogenesis protein CcmH/NrfF